MTVSQIRVALSRLLVMGCVVGLAACGGGGGGGGGGGNPGDVELAIADAGLDEGDGGSADLVFTATLSAASAADVTASYATGGGTATAGTDYTAANGTVIFPAGSTSQTISVAVTGDLAVESDETFNVTLSGVTGAATLSDATAVGTIRDNDSARTLSIGDVEVVEGDAGSTNLTFTVTLSAVSAVNITASYATGGGTATPGTDYTSTNGTITVPAGSTSQTISVAVTGDLAVESDETFNVTLSGVTGDATLADATAVGTIRDDDSVRVLSIGDAEVVEGDAGTSNLAFTVTVSEASGVNVTASYATGGGTATAGADYTSATGTVTIPAGSTSQTVSVAVAGDLLDEADETFNVTLSGVTGDATLADATAVGTIRDNDPVPTLAIGDAQAAEGNSGSAPLDFTVVLSAASGKTVTATFATAAGTATAGSDYVTRTGTVTFTPGQTSRPVSITVNGDTAVEADETFSVALSAPVNATLLDATATGTISNDDVSSGSQFGLDARPSNAACVAPERPVTNVAVSTSDPYSAAPSFAGPTKILQAPGDASRWFVLEKSGRIQVFNVANPGAATTWLNFTSKVNSNFEGGMLGMAFHPNYPATREVFVSYTAPGSPMISRVSRVILDNVTAPSTTTEQIILTVDQPFENHNGGDIAFGPDGYLYFGLGDGGSADDPSNYSQNSTRLLGKMLRIDVVGVAHPNPGYRIPADNPYAANPKCGAGANAASCPEIYASGLRNPWRWSFDAATGELWAGDVGQGAREEVDRIEKGGNYGWNCREGFIAGPNSCAPGGLVDPVSDYPHTNGNNSITGGYVYRGAAIPSLQGRYVFADYGSGRIWALEADGQGGYTNEELIDTPYGITAFALGVDGELYFADFDNGRIRKLVAAGGGSTDTIPSTLAGTGCVAAGNPTQPAAGVIPYGINAPFWSDGAVKERHLAIPDGTRIGITAAGDFDFPSGSVLLKSFRLGGQLIETRLLMRHPDGVWAGYTYEWNDAGTAANRVIGGKTRQVGGQTWIYPSEGECMQCHTSAAGFSLGPEISQLNGLLTYPSTGRTANQLATLEHIDLFTAPLPAPPASLPALTDPTDAGQPLDARARSYLQTNCAQCHRPGGPTPSSMDLRAATALAATNTCDATPQSGSLGITNARLIAPGDAARSVLVARANRRDSNGMPPLGSNVVDSAGVALLTAWINSLGSCQ